MDLKGRDLIKMHASPSMVKGEAGDHKQDGIFSAILQFSSFPQHHSTGTLLFKLYSYSPITQFRVKKQLKAESISDGIFSIISKGR